MTNPFHHQDDTAVTQTDVDILIFSASMTKKCFPKCVKGLVGHGTCPDASLFMLLLLLLVTCTLAIVQYSLRAGALLDTNEKMCLRQCANAYFEAEYLLAYAISSAPHQMHAHSHYTYSKVLSTADPTSTFTFKPKF